MRYCREDASPKFRLKTQKSEPKVTSLILRATKSKCQNPTDLCTCAFMMYRVGVTFLTDTVKSVLQLMSFLFMHVSVPCSTYGNKIPFN